ncbi:hypothetical protein ScalyP_jg5158 [Parmales sp. scaly parma]|nr:hypothetical protein ScalyP_jg5158 [Parmales sp. scaly parma]
MAFCIERQFHVLPLQPSHHIQLLSNNTNLKSSLTSLKASLQATEIQFHNLPLDVKDIMTTTSINTGQNTAKLIPTLINLTPKMQREENKRKSKNFQKHRYNGVRAAQSSSTREYTTKISNPITGPSFALRELGKSYDEKKSFKNASTNVFEPKIKKRNPKEGKGLGAFYSGSNPPELGPGTYNVEMNMGEGGGELGGVGFRDMRTREESQIGAQKVMKGEGGGGGGFDINVNVFSKRSCKSTIGRESVASKFRNPGKLDLSSFKGERFKMVSGRNVVKSEWSPEEFLRKAKERDRPKYKVTAKDYCLGCLDD